MPIVKQHFFLHYKHGIKYLEDVLAFLLKIWEMASQNENFFSRKLTEPKDPLPTPLRRNWQVKIILKKWIKGVPLPKRKKKYFCRLVLRVVFSPGRIFRRNCDRKLVGKCFFPFDFYSFVTAEIWEELMVSFSKNRDWGSFPKIILEIKRNSNYTKEMLNKNITTIKP